VGARSLISENSQLPPSVTAPSALKFQRVASRTPLLTEGACWSGRDGDPETLPATTASSSKAAARANLNCIRIFVEMVLKGPSFHEQAPIVTRPHFRARKPARLTLC
jgi:hypothetical protein